MVASASCKEHLMNVAHVRPDGERPPLTVEDFGPDFAEENTVPVDKELIMGG